MYNSANPGGKLQAAKDYAAENKTNYWDDLLTAEKMPAYDRMGIYNFNMSFYSGARHDDHARFHLIISPRIYFNPSIGTPDVASLGRLFGEGDALQIFSS